MAQIVNRTTARGESRYEVGTRVDGRVVTRTFSRRKDAANYFRMATVFERNATASAGLS
jgi:hypothetical protein